MPDSDAELFAILDKYMNIPAEELPTREEIKAQYPALADEIWRCLEGMTFLKKEEASRQAKLSSFVTPPATDSDVLSDSTKSFSATQTHGGGKRPDVMLGLEPIGDFELVREIARGGMGVVYEAWQNSLNRLVALKVLPLASTFDERQLQRFHNEAAAAAQLEHTGIVPIYAIGTDRGIHYYAMKLINGPHLGTIIHALRDEPPAEKSPDNSTVAMAESSDMAVPESEEVMTDDTVDFQPDKPAVPAPQKDENEVTASMKSLYKERRAEYFRTVAKLMKQAADALDYAHQCGVIHRDIKPANLMLDSENQLWITDFGLAQVRSDVHLTHTGEIFGTPRYMSPEQAQGHNRLADHRVDIYSLGSTFYEFLTLHPLFGKTNHVELLKKITQEEPKKLRAWDPEIPRDLETILLKCLAKLPTDRYETAAELSADLERFLENLPIKARRPGFFELATKWNARHPWFLRFVFLILMTLWLGLAINHHQLSQEKSRTQEALGEAQARFEKARSAADKLVKIAEEELSTASSLEIRRARQKVLDTALVLYQDFLTIDELDPETEQQLTSIRNYVQQFMELLAESDGLPPIFLLMDYDVQTDLQITQEQKEKIMRFNREFREKGEQIFRNSRDVTQEMRVQVMTEQIRSTDSFLKEVLTKNQKARLRQIQLQIQPERILDENVRKELQLTEDQITQLEKKLSISNNRPGRNFEPYHQPGIAPRLNRTDTKAQIPQPPQSRPTPPQFSQRSQRGDFKEILTPEQLKKWESMKGKTFKRMNRMRPPFDRNGWRRREGEPKDTKEPAQEKSNVENSTESSLSEGQKITP
ncbi:MAG: protein kinase [Thermoguttaceae bacterium]|nr:protein kinase [Thermoguttaceae bacterium]